MGVVRNLVKQKEVKSANNGIYASYKNIVLYGSFGKSSLVGALSEKLDRPILVLSPSGGSELLSQEYPNIISYPVESLKEVESIYADLIKDYNAIKNLSQVIKDNDKVRLEKAKAHYKDEWNEIYLMAKTESFPIGAIALEECSIMSDWIQQKLEDDLDVNYVGEDKSGQGIDWSKFSRNVVSFYSKFLGLPITTILETGHIDPKEKQKLTHIAPDISQGNSNRKLTDMIGNVFYCYRTDDLKYKVRITGNKDIYCKDKLLPVKTDKKLVEEIDVTNAPEKFWNYIDSLSENRKIIKNKESVKNGKK